MSSNDFYKGKKVLVTGGLGFIGSNLTIELVNRGAEVTIIDAAVPETGANYFNIEPVKDDVTVVEANLLDEKALTPLVKNSEIIFNLAGLLAHSDSMKEPLRDLEANCTAQLIFLETVRKHNPQAKIVYTGSRNEYGLVKHNPVDEEHKLDPSDINSINMTAGGSYHLLYSRVYEMPIASLRLPNVYGPRHQMKHHRQGVLNWFIRQIMDGNTLKLYGTGEQIRDCNYVADVVNALILCGESPEADGQVFNLGGTPVSLKDYVEKLIEVYGEGEYETIPFPEEAKKIEIGDYVADYSKIKKTLGWEPEVGLEEGLRKTIDYYKENRERYWE